MRNRTLFFPSKVSSLFTTTAPTNAAYQGRWNQVRESSESDVECWTSDGSTVVVLLGRGKCYARIYSTLLRCRVKVDGAVFVRALHRQWNDSEATFVAATGSKRIHGAPGRQQHVLLKVFHVCGHRLTALSPDLERPGGCTSLFTFQNSWSVFLDHSVFRKMNAPESHPPSVSLATSPWTRLVVESLGILSPCS